MPKGRQCFLGWYTLAFPHVQALVGIYLPVALLQAFVLSVPVPVAMLSWLPVLLLGAHFVMSVVGLYEFTSAHGLKAGPGTVVKKALTWLAYQMVLSYAAGRVLYRQPKGSTNLEKSGHVW